MKEYLEGASASHCLVQGYPIEVKWEMQMQDMYVILNFLAAILKKQKETNEIDFSNIFYLTQHIQNISISTCTQYKHYE